jgi:hypothetical protein
MFGQSLLLVLLALLLAPALMILIGIINLISSSGEKEKQKAKRIILIGVILLGIELLIGFSICSHGFN